MNEPSGVARVFYPVEEVRFGVILVVLAAAVVMRALVRRSLPWLADRLPARFRLYLLPLVPILRLAVLTVAALLIVPELIEPRPENVAVVLGASGVAVGFAFKDYATSLIAGMVALYERPYRVGDRVSIAGAYGEVRHVGLRALTLVTPDDTLVTIPQSAIWTSPVFNSNDGQREQLCVADFYLHPEHDAAAVRERLQDVALTSPMLQLKRPVVVAVREEPWGTHYRLKAYPIDGRDEFSFVSDLTVRGKQALAGLGARPAQAQAAAPR